MLKNYLTIAWRNLVRNKTAAIINIAGLTIGITACIIIYLIAGFELGYDRFHPDRKDIYRVVGKVKNREGVENPVGFIPYAVPGAMRQEITGLKSTAAFINFEPSVRVPFGDNEFKIFESRNREKNAPAEIIIAEPQYFDIFSYHWLAGNPATAMENPYQVVLNEEKARKYFGDISPQEMVGKELIYMDSLRMNVSGIVEGWKGHSDLAFTDFISYSTIRSSMIKSFINPDEWNDLWSASQAFVKLEKNITAEQIEAQFAGFSKAHFKGEFQFTPALQPLADLHFNNIYSDNYSRTVHLPTIFGLMAIAFFILMIASINFINLSTAQSFHRAKEVGIRKVMGSSRKSLIFQFLGETLLLTVIAAALSLLLIPEIIRLFETFIPAGIQMVYSFQNMLFLLLIIALTALIAGIYPSFILSSYSPALTLKGKNLNAGGQKGLLRKGLMVFQFTVSLVFILVTLLVSHQISFMRNKDLGFETESVITMKAPRGPENKLPVLYTQVKELTGVENATLQSFEPMGMNFGIDRLIFQGETEQVIDAAYKMGDENFIPFYQIKLLAGRNMLKSDTAKELVISESFVKALGLKQVQDAIGIQLKWREKMYPVVGVVADFHQQSMHEAIPPTFITIAKRPGSMAVRLKHADMKQAQQTIALIADKWSEVYPDKKFEYSFLDETIAAFYSKEKNTSLLVNVATGIAVLLSCLGLYGLSVFSAHQRSKEISIRKLSGASTSNIVVLLSKEFIRVVIIACVLAFPIAWYFMHQWLSDFAYRVNIEWWMFGLAAMLGITIVFLTAGYQAIRAAMENPVKSLRSE